MYLVQLIKNPILRIPNFNFPNGKVFFSSLYKELHLHFWVYLHINLKILSGKNTQKVNKQKIWDSYNWVFNELNEIFIICFLCHKSFDVSRYQLWNPSSGKCCYCEFLTHLYRNVFSRPTALNSPLHIDEYWSDLIRWQFITIITLPSYPNWCQKLKTDCRTRTPNY